MKKNILLLVIISVVLFSCASPKTFILPSGNLDLVRKSSEKDSINSQNDEIATYLKVHENDCFSAYKKESSSAYIEPATRRIKPAFMFFYDLLGEDFVARNSKTIDYLTKRLENVAFVTNNSGFVSLSHAPDANYTRIMSLPFIGYVGGTDIFSFQIENGAYTFRALPEPINSQFWDSHPWVGSDTLCNLVMIWASDRDNPYSTVTTLDRQVIKRGNSDLFYAFKVGNKWSEPKKFDTESLINTAEFNEVSPFVACSNIAPKLLFASNRDKDYDIYEADIEIDFHNQIIKPKDKARKLQKGNQYDFENTYINTDADEMFPLVAFPYYNEYQKELFVSSNRNTNPKNIPKSKDTLVVNKGKFDIYLFNYNLECKLPPPPPPPVAKLYINVINEQQPKQKILLPVIKLVDLTTGKVQELDADNASFTLSNGHKYAIYGGSKVNTSGCNDPQDTIIKYYKARQISFIDPLIVKKERLIEYDTVINPKAKEVFDTTYVTELVPISELETITIQNEFQPVDNEQNPNKNQEQRKEIVKDIKHVKCPPKELLQKQLEQPKLETKIETKTITQTRTTFVEITKQIINRRIEYEGGKILKKSYKIVEYDTIPQLDTTQVLAIGAIARSELTMLEPIEIHFTQDTVINDFVKLYPEYFVKPPCAVKFVDILDDYYKNVPYYQTAFWKVNTSAGLTQHMLDMQKGNYLEDAAYIELHPRNTRYGVWTGEKRSQRISEYREYAKAVDKNLVGMKNEITEHFIPAMEEISKFAPETKLLIKLEAYSDIRDASLCNYIGETVTFIQGRISQNSNIELERITIRNGDNLNSDNDNLSKLRVYHGFSELMALLRKDQKFREYLNNGQVFFPTQKFESNEKMYEALKRAKIIILAEGKKYDPVVKENDKQYDVVRRLNLFIQQIKYEDKIIQSDCCRQK